MSRKIFYLRLSYWAGAVLDGIAGLLMVCPKVGAFLYGIENFNPVPEYKYAIGLGASLMFGWTALLLWADRKPVERKGVLLITVFPVIFGLVITEIYAVISDLITIEKMIPTWVLQAILVALFSFSYLGSRDIK